MLAIPCVKNIGPIGITATIKMAAVPSVQYVWRIGISATIQMFSVPGTKNIGSVCVSPSINMCVCHKICCWQHLPSKAKYQQQCEFTNDAHLKFSLIALYFCQDMDFTDYPQSVQTVHFAPPCQKLTDLCHGGSEFTINQPVMATTVTFFICFLTRWLYVTF